MAKKERLYRGKGTKAKREKEFEDRYGKKKGDLVYGKTVGKIKRLRDAKRKKRK